MRWSRTRIRAFLPAAFCGLCLLLVAGAPAFAQVPPAASPVVCAPAPVTPPYRLEPDPGRVHAPQAIAVAPSPIIAPVGTEVVVVAGVRGSGNFLLTNERVEWSIAPGGVGQFVDVGRNGLTDLIFGVFHRGKVDATYAVGTTSIDNVRLTRGTPTPTDDVLVASGQAWAAITSPVEGTTYVMAYAPGVFGWDAHRQTGLIHWIDAVWQFPPPAINPAGTRHVFTTTVLRQSDQSPSSGWRVLYQILDGPPAGFAPHGGPSAEVEVNAMGQASVEIIQPQPAPGTNRIAIQVHRPAGACLPGGRPLAIASGSTLMTWTAPQIAVRKVGPPVAALGSTFNYQLTVSNPGDLPAEEVLVADEVPELLAYVSSQPPAEVKGRRLEWRLGRLAGRQSATLTVTLRALARGSASACVEAMAAGGLRARDCATTTIASAALGLRIEGPSQAVPVGATAGFRILITNQAPVAATGLLIKDRFDAGLEHPAARGSIERDLGALGPGETHAITVDFRVAQPGRLCHTVEIRQGAEVLATARACLEAVAAAPAAGAQGPSVPVVPSPSQPPATPTPSPSVSPPTGSPAARPPSVSIEASAPSSVRVGQTVPFRITVRNTSPVAQTQVQVSGLLDPALSAQQASNGFQRRLEGLVWVLPSIAPNQVEAFEIHCRAERPTRRACLRASVTSSEGARAEKEVCVEILPEEKTPSPPPPEKKIEATPKPPEKAPEKPAAKPSTTQPPKTTPELTASVFTLRNPVEQGRELTYEIRVTATSPAPATGVTVTAFVPPGMLPVPFGTYGPSAEASINGQVVRFAPATISGSATYKVRTRADRPGEHQFRVEVMSPKLKEPLTAKTTTTVLEASAKKGTS